MDKTDRDELKGIITEVLQTDLIKPYYVDREQHYQDHLFIKAFKDWCDTTKQNIWKTFIRIVVTGAIILIVLGFIFWGKGHLGVDK